MSDSDDETIMNKAGICEEDKKELLRIQSNLKPNYNITELEKTFHLKRINTIINERLKEKSLISYKVLSNGNYVIGFSDSSIKIYNKNGFKEESNIKISESEIKEIGLLSDDSIVVCYANEKIKILDKNLKPKELPLDIGEYLIARVLSKDRILFDKKENEKNNIYIYNLKEPYNILFKKEGGSILSIGYEIKSKNLLIIFDLEGKGENDYITKISFYSLEDYSFKQIVEINEGINCKLTTIDNENKIVLYSSKNLYILNVNTYLIEKIIDIPHKTYNFIEYTFDFTLKDGNVPFYLGMLINDYFMERYIGYAKKKGLIEKLKLQEAQKDYENNEEKSDSSSANAALNHTIILSILNPITYEIKKIESNYWPFLYPELYSLDSNHILGCLNEMTYIGHSEEEGPQMYIFYEIEKDA